MEEGHKKVLLYVGLLSLVILSLVIYLSASSPLEDSSISDSDSFTWHGNVKVTYSEWDTETNSLKEPVLIGQQSNLLYTNGGNVIKEILGNGANMGAINNISLCNASAGAGAGCGTPTAGATEDYNQYDGCGLSSLGGSYDSLGNGNWSIYGTFTSSCDSRLTNVTRLQNSSGSIVAGSNFTLVTLQTNDQITINWTVFVTWFLPFFKGVLAILI